VVVIGETAEGTRVVATGSGRDDLAAAIEDRGIVGDVASLP
jgi:hypothetical protein